MVEDEDAGCAGSVGEKESVMNWESASGSERGMVTVHVRVFQKLLRLGIVHRLDLIVIRKVFLFTFVTVDMEAILVKSELNFPSTDIIDNDVKWFKWSLVCLWLADICRCGLTSVAGVFVIV